MIRTVSLFSPSCRPFRVLLLTGLLPWAGCTEPPPPEPPPAAPPPQVEVRLTQIDDQDIVAGSPPEIGLQAKVAWTTSAQDVVTCVLVHPMQGDTWWVQNLPSLPDPVASGVWGWRTIAFFGNQDVGRGEEFETLALAEGTRNICQTNRQLKVEELPADLPRSGVLLVRRVRD